MALQFNKSQTMWVMWWLLALFFFLSVIILLILHIAFSHLLTFRILQWSCTMSHLCGVAVLIIHRNYTEMSRLNHIFDLLCVHTAAISIFTLKVGKLQACCREKVPGKYFFYRHVKNGFLKENRILREGNIASSLNLLDFHVLCVILQLSTNLASPDLSHRAIRNTLIELDKT